MEQIHTNPDIFMVHNSSFQSMVGATNSYIIKDGESGLIIDVGPPVKDGGLLFRKNLEALDLHIDNVSFFFTHLHFDHAGSSATLITDDNKVYVSAAEYEKTRNLSTLAHANDLKERLLCEGASRATAEISRKHIIESAKLVHLPHTPTLVKEGDVIRVGKYELIVIDTAGHTEGHASLFEPVSKSIFIGDHVLYSLSPSIDFFTDHRDGVAVYLSNLEKILHLPIENLLQAHGKIRTDHTERIEWLIDHHKERFSRVSEMVSCKKDLLGVEIIKSMGWNTKAKSWVAIPLLQKSVILTQGVAILDHLVLEEKIERYQDERNRFHYLPKTSEHN